MHLLIQFTTIKLLKGDLIYMEKQPKINIISSIGSDLEESFRDLINIIEKLREDIDELQEWKKKIRSIE